jgi:hypothetical protein
MKLEMMLEVYSRSDFCYGVAWNVRTVIVLVDDVTLSVLIWA